MAVLYVSGDLFLAPRSFPAIGHGCNCSGSMGKGIAVTFRKRFPRMYDAYRAACQMGALVPGNVFPWKQDDDEKAVWVYNLGTQKHWRGKAKREYIDASLNVMRLHARDNGVRLIALPRIGAGLGGLNWDDVRPLFTRHFSDNAVDLIVFEDYIAGAAPTLKETVGAPRPASTQAIHSG